MDILQTDKGENKKFLHKKVPETNLDKEETKEMRKLIKKMRKTMIEADGVGLSANQVGLSKRLFVAQIYDENGKPKFYSVFNPEITEKSEETDVLVEGCLSIPGKHGPVERATKITLEGQNLEGKRLKIQAWGILARIFQHEVDHLNGVLFTDKAEEIYEEKSTEEPIN